MIWALDLRVTPFTEAQTVVDSTRLRDVISVFDFIPAALQPGILANLSTTSVSAYVQLAVTAANGRVLEFPSGTYVLGAPVVLSGLNDVVLRGPGATIKGTSSRFQSYFDVSGATSITFEGLTFNQLKTLLPAYDVADFPNIYNCPIYGNTGFDKIIARDCTFTNLYTTAIWLYTGGSLLVENCRFSSPTQTNDQQCSHIYVQTIGPEFIVRGSRFENAAETAPSLPANGIFCSGLVGRAYVQDNYFNYCGRSASLDVAHNHRLGAIDFYADVENVHVTGNIAENCLAQFMRLSSCHTGLVARNKVTVSANAEVGYSTLTLEGIVAGAKKGIRDITVEDNRFMDASGRAAFTVGVLAYDWGAPSTAIKVLNNTFVGCKISTLVAGPYYDVSIRSNICRDGGGTIEVQPGTGLTSIEGAEVDAVFDRLFVNSNSTHNPKPGDNSNGFISKLSTTTSAYVGYMEICDNVFRGNGNLGVGITLFGNSSVKANNTTVCRGNEVQGFNFGIYVRDTGDVILENNRTLDIGDTALIGGTASTLLHKRGNRWASGVLSGTAKLAGGTVTVPNDEILAGDRVNLSRGTASGASGRLSVGTIVADKSFVIHSNNPADTSVIFWEIVH